MPLVSHGYPDFNRVVSQADVLFVSQTNITISGATTYPMGYVGNQPFVGIKVFSTVGSFRVHVRFWTDATLSIPLAGFGFDIGPLGSCTTSVPVGGPFCTVIVTPDAPNRTFGMHVWSAPAEFGAAFVEGDDNVLLGAQGQGIGAGANTTFTAVSTIPGFAIVNASTTATNWVGHLTYVDYLGAVHHLHFFAPTVKTYTQLIFLPAMPVALNLQNNDAAAQSFDFSIIARPWSPGR